MKIGVGVLFRVEIEAKVRFLGPILKSQPEDHGVLVLPNPDQAWKIIIKVLIFTHVQIKISIFTHVLQGHPTQSGPFEMVMIDEYVQALLL